MVRLQVRFPLSAPYERKPWILARFFLSIDVKWTKNGLNIVYIWVVNKFIMIKDEKNSLTFNSYGCIIVKKVINMDRIEKRIAILYGLRRNRINQLLESYHLTYEDYEIILALHYAEGLSVEEIEAETKIDLRLLKLILKHLVEKNFIEIKDDKLFLSEDTQKIYPQIKRAIKDNNDELIKSLTLDEFHDIIEKLDRLIECYE